MTGSVTSQKKPKRRGRPAKFGVAMSAVTRQRLARERRAEQEQWMTWGLLMLVNRASESTLRALPDESREALKAHLQRHATAVPESVAKAFCDATKRLDTAAEQVARWPAEREKRLAELEARAQARAQRMKG